MIGKKGMKVGVALAGIVLLFAAGCAKRQTVRSNENMEPVAAATPAPAQEKSPAGITTETIPPEPHVPAGPVATGALTEPQPSPFRDIHFDFDKSFIEDADRPTLAGIAGYLTSHPKTHVLIEGNCDERGTEEYNMMLGDRRADSARRYLVALGVPAGDLNTISFGKDKPVDPGHNEEAWARNRNDHFVTQ